MNRVILILAFVLNGVAFGQDAPLTPSGAAKAVLEHSYQVKSRDAAIDAAQAAVRRADAMDVVYSGISGSKLWGKK